ncbi:dihydroorotate dehydrogenase electron transfer subunit [Sunxiuqinia elliptica]|uniref:Dihydroorotate dehydrogenase electron transfer subunit n=1 Tax=Sunxiuqinia elliptica TaxID=655355 RepID=A0A1I2GZH5_9BACT|nr:dihydroorotate dehydrogenase electron transfer subunit [Sunxiuqinia elliptica]SFF21931.1 dihydroorotate dehydrogenase electron transfer subunit [Sunxiuqinia elliptica]
MKKTVQELLLVENKQLNHDNFKLVLQAPTKLPEIFPGQFVNIEIKKATEIFLRRPFSVLDVDYENNTFSLLVKILGRGSKVLTTYEEGEKISVVYPLGNSFTLPQKQDKVLLIGGGSGVAPMLFLAKICGLPAENVHVILGARSQQDHVNIDAYQAFGNYYFTTEDGSLGEKGFVTHHPVFTNELSTFDRVYTCGPDMMMKAVAKEAAVKGISCEVSLENMMACGFGVCLCCVEKTKEGNQCVCTEGPVFNINKLTW